MLVGIALLSMGMGGGILQARPSVAFDPSTVATPAVRQLAVGAALPKVVVFDLDNTLWTPELYTLRKLPGYAGAELPGPRAGTDVWLLDGAAAALHELATCEEWSSTRIAVASRTNKGRWAEQLLRDFACPGVPGTSLANLLAQAEIYPGSKVKHFEALSEGLGVDYGEMLFFDDAADGPYGNCAAVSKLGVLSAHCPLGLTVDVWRDAVAAYAESAAAGEPKGRILRPASRSTTQQQAASGRASASSYQGGRVAKYLEAKRFGFVQLDGRRDQAVFFHESALESPAAAVGAGARVQVQIGTDRQGRRACTSVRLAEGSDAAGASGGALAGDGAAAGAPSVTLPCFSMNMPFAGLLGHGIKTIESRNHTMFEGTAGSTALLHVGRRTYPDGGKHLDILRAAGLADGEIARCTSLPEGFSRGQVVAALELGETTLSTLEERSTPAAEARCCAYGADSGRYLTEVRRIEWLREPVNMKGRPGLFRATVPAAALPEAFRADVDP